MKTYTKVKGWEIKNWLDNNKKDAAGIIKKYFNSTNSLNLQRDYFIIDKKHNIYNYYKIARYTTFYGGTPEEIELTSKTIAERWGF